MNFENGAEPHTITSVCDDIFACQYGIKLNAIVNTENTFYMDMIKQFTLYALTSLEVLCTPNRI